MTLMSLTRLSLSDGNLLISQGSYVNSNQLTIIFKHEKVFTHRRIGIGFFRG